MIPRLLSPKIKAFKNSLRGRTFWSRETVRDFVVISLGIGIMVVLYRGAEWSLSRINSDPNLVFLPPELPLGMIFAILLVMLTMSNIVTAVSTLYFGADLELVLASPLSPPRFFGGKFVYILLSSSWTSIVFIAPLVAAFGVSHRASFDFYFFSSLVLIGYFLIPTALAIILSSLFVRFIPPRRLKVLLYLGFAIVLTGIWTGIDLVRDGASAVHDRGQLLGVLSFISSASASWMPSTWLASAMQELLLFQGKEYWSFANMIFSVAFAFLGLSYLTIQIYHFEAYTIARSVGVKKIGDGGVTKRPFLFALPFVQTFRGLTAKEILLFFREITCTLQILMLGGICLIYLLNLRLFGDFSGMTGAVKRWWESFFFISNWCIGAFVTTGICTRFVFPSLSLEGKGIWLLKASPVSLEEIIQTKFSFWYPPVALVASLILTVGAYAVGFSPWVTFLNTISGIILAYGIVGLAIGFGARFSNFDWEHSSQLAASFGSLVFMLSSMTLILISLFIMWGAFFAGDAQFLNIDDGEYLFGGIGFLTVALINMFVARVSVAGGQRAVLRKLS